MRAIEEIERVGIPKGRSSKKFLLEYNNKHYPPKYLISLANKYANGKELRLSEFSGGNESNNFLKYLGFNIVGIQSYERHTPKPSIRDNKIPLQKTAHDERCPRCKKAIKAMLEKIYGKVETNYKFEIGTYPENFRSSPYHNNLKEIYETLQNQRGFKEFVKAKTLPNCDFFVPDPGFIVEFDESQHFTLLRKSALEHYPEKLKLEFDRKKWMTLCERIDAKDNDPPYRDEQRAWYDTLRDFLPTIIKSLGPTIRLFARDFVWCSLNQNNPYDVKRFESLLKAVSENWKIEIRENVNPFLARIIIAEDWRGKPEEARRLLETICKKWPNSKRAKFIITCGGFIQFDWPEQISRKDIGDNKYPNKNAVNTLVKKAEKCAKFVLNTGLTDKLRKLADYITLGIDSHLQRDNSNLPHIELVLLINLKNNRLIHWTGKSYPVSGQQNGLVRITDLETHFVEKLEDEGNIMLLGCHDLKMFDPRHYKRKNMKNWRKNTIKEFHQAAKKRDPKLVLQHPHSTVKKRTWYNAWLYLRKELPSVEKYASAGKFYEPNRKLSEYDALEDVLKNTKYCNTIDFIVRSNRER